MISDAQMIGAALKGEREKRNISRLEASRLSGVYREQMPNWESGANCISLPMLRLLAEAYGMTPSQIGRVVMGGLTPVKVPQARKPGVVQNVCWRPNKKMRKELA